MPFVLKSQTYAYAYAYVLFMTYTMLNVIKQHTYEYAYLYFIDYVSCFILLLIILLCIDYVLIIYVSQ